MSGRSVKSSAEPLLVPHVGRGLRALFKTPALSLPCRSSFPKQFQKAGVKPCLVAPRPATR
jgi:hypothetical protein